MGTKAVILNNSTPVSIDHLLAVLFRADAVLPVIFIGKTSAGPAKNRDLQFLKSFNNVLTHSVDIIDVVAVFYIKTLVNTSSKVLREMSLNLRIYVSFVALWIDAEFKHGVSFF